MKVVRSPRIRESQRKMEMPRKNKIQKAKVVMDINLTTKREAISPQQITGPQVSTLSLVDMLDD